MSTEPGALQYTWGESEDQPDTFFFHEQYTDKDFEDLCFEFGVELDDICTEAVMHRKEKSEMAAGGPSVRPPRPSWAESAVVRGWRVGAAVSAMTSMRYSVSDSHSPIFVSGMRARW